MDSFRTNKQQDVDYLQCANLPLNLPNPMKPMIIDSSIHKDISQSPQHDIKSSSTEEENLLINISITDETPEQLIICDKQHTTSYFDCEDLKILSSVFEHTNSQGCDLNLSFNLNEMQLNEIEFYTKAQDLQYASIQCEVPYFTCAQEEYNYKEIEIYEVFEKGDIFYINNVIESRAIEYFQTEKYYIFKRETAISILDDESIIISVLQIYDVPRERKLFTPVTYDLLLKTKLTDQTDSAEHEKSSVFQILRTDTQETSEYLWLIKTVWVKRIPPTKHPPKFPAKRMKHDIVHR